MKVVMMNVHFELFWKTPLYKFINYSVKTTYVIFLKGKISVLSGLVALSSKQNNSAILLEPSNRNKLFFFPSGQASVTS